MEQQNNQSLQIVLLILRILVTIYCVNRARDLNRNKTGWGIFAFCIPILAIIWIQFIKPISNVEKNESIN